MSNDPMQRAREIIRDWYAERLAWQAAENADISLRDTLMLIVIPPLLSFPTGLLHAFYIWKLYQWFGAPITHITVDYPVVYGLVCLLTLLGARRDIMWSMEVYDRKWRPLRESLMYSVNTSLSLLLYTTIAFFSAVLIGYWSM